MESHFSEKDFGCGRRPLFYYGGWRFFYAKKYATICSFRK